MKKRNIVTLFLVAVFVLPLGIDSGVVADDHIPDPGSSSCGWAQYRKNNFNNAFTTLDCGPMCDDLDLMWFYGLPGGVNEHLYAPPVVDYERVVVGSVNTTPGFGGHLYCFYEGYPAGAPVVPAWDTLPLAGDIYASPTIYDEKVYAGTDTGVVYCYDLLGTTTGGELIWTAAYSGGIYGSITELSGRLYFGTELGLFYCIESKDGTVIWLRSDLNGEGIKSTPVVANGRVWFSTTDGYLYCLDANTGKTLPGWPQNTVYNANGFSPTLDYEYLYFPNSELFSFEALGGKRIFPTEPKQNVNTNLAVEPIPTSNHVLSISGIYHGTDYKTMYKLHESGKHKLWKNNNVTFEGINSSPSITPKRAYLTSQNYLQLFDTATGQRMNKIDVFNDITAGGGIHHPSETLTSIAIAYNKLYFCSTSCNVICYHCKPNQTYPSPPFVLHFMPTSALAIPVDQGGSFQFSAWLTGAGLLLSQFSDKITFRVDDNRYADIDDNGLLTVYDHNTKLSYPHVIHVSAHIDVTIQTGPTAFVHVVLDAPLPYPPGQPILIPPL